MREAGEALFVPAGEHLTENTSDSFRELILVELKEPCRHGPATSWRFPHIRRQSESRALGICSALDSVLRYGV